MNWKEFRKIILTRDNNNCQKCGSLSYLHIHHKKPTWFYPELEYDEKNCITLCTKCHAKEHTGHWKCYGVLGKIRIKNSWSWEKLYYEVTESQNKYCYSTTLRTAAKELKNGIKG